jgi:hypothetical protein
MKAAARNWWSRHVISDDPHPELDDGAGMHPLGFLVFLLLCIAFYLVAGWYIFSR